MSKITFPTEPEFSNANGVAQANPTLKWRDLEQARIYAITKVRRVKTKFGEAAIGRLLLPDGWERDVWLPERLSSELSDRALPVFVRPMGLKPTRGDPLRSYHHYELM